jgi:hypothetical protein
MALVAVARGPTTRPMQPCSAALYKVAATTTAPALAPLGWAQGRAITLMNVEEVRTHRFMSTAVVPGARQGGRASESNKAAKSG